MKIALTFITALLLTTAIAVGQDLQFVEVETNQILNTNADQTWAIVQDWKNLHQLAPKVVAATTVNGKGMQSSWQIQLVNGGEITEKMIYYNSAERTMSYVMTATPMPIENYMAVIKVEHYGVSKSLVSFYTSCNTAAEHFDNIKNTFEDFQKMYLSNIEKQRQ